MQNEELFLILKNLIHSFDEGKLQELLDNYHPYDIASIFKEFNDQERQAIYEILSEEQIASILSYLSEDEAAEYIKEMSYKQGAFVLNEMDTDDAADILKELEEEVETNEYLGKLAAEDANELRELSKHDEDSAGSIMTTNFITIPSGIDVKEAMKILGKEANDAEVIDPLFVCKDGYLLGTLSLQDLIIARTPKNVDEIMNDSFIYSDVDQDKEDVINKITNYDTYALPILDKGKLVGIVTMDDALDVATEELEEDFSMMAAVSSEESKNAPFWKNIIKRIPWLVALLFVSLLISNVTSIFEDVISKITVLWFFNTMILDMSGNAGTQTLAVTVRQISRGELENAKKVFKYLAREFLVTLLNSLFLGVLSFIVCYIFIKLLGYDARVNIIITSLIISGSLVITLTCTGTLGAVIPILMDKIKIDPAVASGPFITTLNDIIAMLIYFGLSMIFMEYILL